MRWKWDIDGDHRVETDYSPFTGRTKVRLNGEPVFDKMSWRLRTEAPFDLADGRSARVTIRLEGLIAPRAQLHVDGDLVTAAGVAVRACAECGAPVRAYDRFCESCGKPLPSAEDVERQARVKRATSTILAVAGLFAAFGVVMFFVQRSNTNQALANLASHDASEILSVAGHSYTVAELRVRVAQEPWTLLVVNLVLAAVMVGLALWSKRAPLPAILAAAAVYAVVIVGNAIVDPMTLGQGLLMKVVIIAFLVNGIRASLDLRPARARAL